MDAVGGFVSLNERNSIMSRVNGNGRPQGQPPKAESNDGGGRQPPFSTLQIGVLKAVIWKNVSDKGDWYSVDFSRGYKDSAGIWKSADTFGVSDLLAVAKLSEMAWELIIRETGANLS
jgi:hypothetical protein